VAGEISKTECSLSVLDAAAIMAIYAKRMRIEPSFRDLKNERLGLGFSSARAHSAKRLERVLLIAHWSTWLMRLVGECAQKC
jgi:IS4 transposase